MDRTAIWGSETEIVAGRSGKETRMQSSTKPAMNLPFFFFPPLLPSLDSKAARNSEVWTRVRQKELQEKSSLSGPRNKNGGYYKSEREGEILWVLLLFPSFQPLPQAVLWQHWGGGEWGK